MASSGDNGAAARTTHAVLAAAFVVIVWQLACATGVWSRLILPTPHDVWNAFVDSITTHNGRPGFNNYFLWEHLYASCRRIFLGVLIAVVVGVPVGLLVGISRTVALLAEPIIGFLRSLPPLGYFALLILWFGIDDASKVWLLFLAAFPPIAIAVATGVSGVRRERVEAALVLGASRRDVARHVILPSVAPEIFMGIRIATGFAWTTVVAAETSNGLPGIGGLAWATKKELRTDVAILCVIVIGIVAVALDTVLLHLQRRAVPWSNAR